MLRAVITSSYSYIYGNKIDSTYKLNLHKLVAAIADAMKNRVEGIYAIQEYNSFSSYNDFSTNTLATYSPSTNASIVNIIHSFLSVIVEINEAHQQTETLKSSISTITALISAVTSRVKQIDNIFSNTFILQLNADLIEYSENNTFVESFHQPLWSDENHGKAKTLTRIFISNIRKLENGFEYWADLYEDTLLGVLITDELLKKIVFLPAEITDQSPVDINSYLINLVNAKKPLNRVRAIFIGYGAAGKTSLIKTLNHEQVISGKEDMTPGIDIREWNIPGTEIVAHLWDFGGQVMAHAIHQFFLRARCVYVIVMDARAEINANEQAEYWLEHVRAFGEDAPVLLVGNKVDLSPISLDMTYLKNKYPNIIDFYPMSCLCYQGELHIEYDKFFRDFIITLKSAETHQMWFTESQFKVLEILRHLSPKENFLSYSQYDEICRSSGVRMQGQPNKEWLLQIFDALGVVIYFPDIQRLESYVLNPRWLTYGVYTLLYSKEASKSKGQISIAEIEHILQNKPVQDNLGNTLIFPKDKCSFIIDAMESFKICYRMRNNSDFIIIPVLLSQAQPPTASDFSNAMTFEFDFSGFLPRHVMPTFIVSRHHEITNNMVWQNGVYLTSLQYAAEALVRVDYHQRILTLSVQGNQANRYFTILHDELCIILSRMPQLQYSEWVGLPSHARIGEAPLTSRGKKAIASFRQLLTLEAVGENRYPSVDGSFFRVDKVLQIMPKDEREKYSRQININATHVAYVEGDSHIISFESEKEEFLSHVHLLDNKLKELFIEIAKGEHSIENTSNSLEEIDDIRKKLTQTTSENAVDRTEGMKSMLSWGKKIKEGTSDISSVLKSTRESAELAAWIIDKLDKISSFI